MTWSTIHSVPCLNGSPSTSTGAEGQWGLLWLAIWLRTLEEDMIKHISDFYPRSKNNLHTHTHTQSCYSDHLLKKYFLDRACVWDATVQAAVGEVTEFKGEHLARTYLQKLCTQTWLQVMTNTESPALEGTSQHHSVEPRTRTPPWPTGC